MRAPLGAVTQISLPALLNSAKEQRGLMNAKIVLLPGDGIGPEVVAQAERVLRRVGERFHHTFNFVTCPIGGCAIDEFGDPLPERTLAECRSSQAVLLGYSGGQDSCEPAALAQQFA